MLRGRLCYTTPHMPGKDIQLEPTWKAVLSTELQKPYFISLTDFVRTEYMSGVDIYPKPQDIFRAFETCPFNKIKVVILGQDPYHGARQAMGLSFAVHTGTAIPPSLQNIFKEVQSDIGITPIADGDLTRWASQGVLLLNATLTVRGGLPGSHQKKGWEEFTDAVIRTLSDQCEHIVFILWGNYAKQKGSHIDRTKHLVIESAHPSPFSAYNGFFGSKPFSKTNEYLRKYSLTEINWQ